MSEQILFGSEMCLSTLQSLFHALGMYSENFRPLKCSVEAENLQF